MDSITKTCVSCGKTKSESEFGWRNKSSHKKRGYCKSCWRDRTRRHRGATERRCKGCDEIKLTTEFPWKDMKASKRHTRCKVCQQWASKNWYARLSRNRKQTIKDSVKRRTRLLLEFAHTFKSGPCNDCGRSFHPWQMDFDHRPGEKKEFSIGQAHTRGISQERIVREIAKCDLVCACCHRHRTYLRRLEGPK
jgi:hypothetical protein